MDTSFLSRAKSVFQTAATKAERILAEFKDDFKSDLTITADTNNALQTAVAKAERMLTELKQDFGLSSCKSTGIDASRREIITSDSSSEQQFKGTCVLDLSKYDEVIENLKLQYVPAKMKEQEFWRYYTLAVSLMKQEAYGLDVCNANFHNLAICSSQEENPNESLYKKATPMVIPPSKILRRLAVATEISNSIGKVKDLSSFKNLKMVPSENGGIMLGFTALKNSLLRDSKSSRNQEIHDCMKSLFENDAHLDASFRTWYCESKPKLPEDIHSVPPGTFVSQLAEIMGGLETGQMMVEFWDGLIEKLCGYWENGQPIPKLEADSKPELCYCLLHQKLQVINCCIARQHHRAALLQSVDALCEGAEYIGRHFAEDLDDSFQSVVHIDGFLEPSRLFAKGKEGQLLLRLGADTPVANLKMLETEEQVYSPVTQEGPLLTEDAIEETEKFVLRTGSLGAGCSQLLSDMQSFKAANPGCILEDFVRWHSPLDWCEGPSSKLASKDANQDSRGCLSARMQSKGNLWQELWASSKPIPAAKQAPLFDEDLAVESVLNGLEEIVPVQLFEQLFKAVLCSGFLIAESCLSMNGCISVRFKKLKSEIVSACKNGTIFDQLEQLCQAYEIMEAMFQRPSEELQEPNPMGVNKQNVFRKLINEQLAPANKFSSLTRILKTKSSLFERKLSNTFQ